MASESDLNASIMSQDTQTPRSKRIQIPQPHFDWKICNIQLWETCTIYRHVCPSCSSDKEAAHLTKHVDICPLSIGEYTDPRTQLPYRCLHPRTEVEVRECDRCKEIKAERARAELAWMRRSRDGLTGMVNWEGVRDMGYMSYMRNFGDMSDMGVLREMGQMKQLVPMVGMGPVTPMTQIGATGEMREMRGTWEMRDMSEVMGWIETRAVQEEEYKRIEEKSRRRVSFGERQALWQNGEHTGKGKWRAN